MGGLIYRYHDLICCRNIISSAPRIARRLRPRNFGCEMCRLLINSICLTLPENHEIENSTRKYLTLSHKGLALVSADAGAGSCVTAQWLTGQTAAPAHNYHQLHLTEPESRQKSSLGSLFLQVRKTHKSVCNVMKQSSPLGRLFSCHINMSKVLSL